MAFLFGCLANNMAEKRTIYFNTLGEISPGQDHVTVDTTILTVVNNCIITAKDTVFTVYVNQKPVIFTHDNKIRGEMLGVSPQKPIEEKKEIAELNLEHSFFLYNWYWILATLVFTFMYISYSNSKLRENIRGEICRNSIQTGIEEKITISAKEICEKIVGELRCHEKEMKRYISSVISDSKSTVWTGIEEKNSTSVKETYEKIETRFLSFEKEVKGYINAVVSGVKKTNNNRLVLENLNAILSEMSTIASDLDSLKKYKEILAVRNDTDEEEPKSKKKSKMGNPKTKKSAL